jgi:hypothetical protein
MLWMRQKLTENLTLALREIANLDASEAKLPVQPCQNGACGDREAHDHGENRIGLGRPWAFEARGRKSPKRLRPPTKCSVGTKCIKFTKRGQPVETAS